MPTPEAEVVRLRARVKSLEDGLEQLALLVKHAMTSNDAIGRILRGEPRHGANNGAANEPGR